jgi:hypothetical protein
MCGIFVFINSRKQGGSSMQEKSKIKKEKWGKPMLTILVKGLRREERVLAQCKRGAFSFTSGAGNEVGGCMVMFCSFECSSTAFS